MSGSRFSRPVRGSSSAKRCRGSPLLHAAATSRAPAESGGICSIVQPAIDVTLQPAASMATHRAGGGDASDVLLAPSSSTWMNPPKRPHF